MQGRAGAHGGAGGRRSRATQRACGRVCAAAGAAGRRRARQHGRLQRAPLHGRGARRARRCRHLRRRRLAAPLETPLETLRTRCGHKEDRWNYRGSGVVALQPRHLGGICTLQRICHSICGLPGVAHVRAFVGICMAFVGICMAFVNICTVTPIRPSLPDSMLNSLLPRTLVAVLVSLEGSRQPAQSPKCSNPRRHRDKYGAHVLARVSSVSVGAKFDESGSQPSHLASLIVQVTTPVLSTAMLTRTSKPPSPAPPS